LLKADIESRLIDLANSVQDPNRHRFFAPGTKWWLASKSQRATGCKLIEGAMLFCEQLGITDEQWKKVYKSKWTAGVGMQHPFLLLRKRRLSNVTFVTFDMVNEHDDWGDTSTTPQDSNAIVKNCSAYRRLLKEVEVESEVRTKNIVKAPAAGVQAKKTPPQTTSSKPPPSVQRMAPAASVQAKKTAPHIASPSPNDHDAAPMPTESPLPDTATAILSIITPSFRQPAPLTASHVLEYSQSLRKQPSVDNSTLMLTKHTAHELMSMLSEQALPSRDVKLNSKHGGRATTWTRVVERRGGKSLQTERRITKDVTAHTAKQTQNLPGEAKNRVASKAYTKGHSEPMFQYTKHNRLLLVLNSQDQQNLQTRGGMTDRQMLDPSPSRSTTLCSTRQKSWICMEPLASGPKMR
jgi:hypothetical protein